MGLVDHRSQATRPSFDALLKHMQTFELDLMFSAGIWYFAPDGGRFHDRFMPPMDISARLDLAASLKDAGVVGIEAHYPNEINESNLEIWKQFVRDTGIRLITVIPLLFFDAAFEWGPLRVCESNRVRQARCNERLFVIHSTHQEE